MNIVKRSLISSGIATVLSFILYFSFEIINSYYLGVGTSIYYFDILQLVFLPQSAGGVPLLSNLAVPVGVLLAIVFAVLLASIIDIYGPFHLRPSRVDLVNYGRIRSQFLQFLMYLWMVVFWSSLLMTLYWFWLLFFGGSLVGSGGATVLVFMLYLASPQLFGFSFLLFHMVYYPKGTSKEYFHRITYLFSTKAAMEE